MYKNFRRMLPLYNGARRALIISQILLFLTVATNQVVMALNARLINDGVEAGNIDVVISTAMWMIGLTLVLTVFSIGNAIYAIMFSDTVMANLRYAREGATDEECIAAARQANAHDFIMQLPSGYDTVLTERGANLSQGQRQMVTIARAMVANPKILVLDEATSNVDTRTEKLIQEGLKKLMEGKTSFVVAHRLSTIQDSDQILVINRGEIIERGTHEALLAQRGFYFDLYMSQFKGKLAQFAAA